jgi:hypothetical protein
LNPRSSMLFVFNFWNQKLKTQKTRLSVQLLVSKVGDQELSVLGPQLSMPKVEDQEH